MGNEWVNLISPSKDYNIRTLLGDFKKFKALLACIQYRYINSPITERQDICIRLSGLAFEISTFIKQNQDADFGLFIKELDQTIRHLNADEDNDQSWEDTPRTILFKLCLNSAQYNMNNASDKVQTYFRNDRALSSSVRKLRGLMESLELFASDLKITRRKRISSAPAIGN